MSLRPVAALTADEALRLRLAGQRLDRPAAAGSLVETCGAIGAAQAQVGSAARLSLAARVDGLRAGDVERAMFAEKTLIKTWTVRGTLHLVPSADLPLHVAGFGPHRMEFLDRALVQSGLAAKDGERLSDEVVAALADGPLTRQEIADKIGAAHGSLERKWLVSGWGGVLRRGHYEGRVCFGPQRGTEVTFVRADRWLAPTARKRIPTAEAEAALVRRYVRAYGPSTARDFAFWAGLYVPRGLAMWERIADELVPVTVDGAPAFVHAEDRAAVARLVRERRRTEARSPHVVLLPHFDAYLLGHKMKDAVVAAAKYKRVFRTAGWIAPVVLVDGRIAGTWEPGRARGAFTAQVRGFTPVTPTLRAAARAAFAPLAAFEGLEPRLNWR